MNKYQIINHSTKKTIIVEANSAQEAAQQVGCRIKQVTPIDIGQPKLSGMPISKAIEILQLNLKEAGLKMPPDCAAAIALGSEAFKLILTMRKNRVIAATFPLPGETKD